MNLNTAKRNTLKTKCLKCKPRAQNCEALANNKDTQQNKNTKLDFMTLKKKIHSRAHEIILKKTI